ncbi:MULTISPECIES: sigma-54 dependent transcriptional regulator [unclassified Photobacterium]|uniref:sigma-54-dependent transcriptional regulator n=1 Tax=unclassified Photobacterium TaxID=2628852 RepID=UPI000D160DA7|nr:MULTISPECIES: VpsR-related response regulator [unclassified Photobacterium]PSV27884.1 sigma-54-dependent Fis family transcriptional regulator [Photobacterium sp. GB-56]PSV31974.1 sigma-54-dependent Fis family transcriptional regulator [Photobacterium sp. GB-72]PSV36258.1 sigma-54-dependent Fis family transcriptional regulator [Photobacterium sp. GB-210]PSV50823.1 sigma-54-dependent Fis family transcriptional regulator [Photobacterium sp. GB-1]PSV54424.1 sigma-54-dependent Fis family transcr
MLAQCDKKTFKAKLVAIGCTYEPWIALLEQTGWKTHCCYDLRTADAILEEYSPCICIVDLSNNDFSLNSISLRANKTKQVKWIAVIKKEQLGMDAICQFINNYCVDYFSIPIPSTHLLETVGHQLGMLEIESNSWTDAQQDVGLFGESKSIKHLRDMVRRVAMTDVNIFISGEQGTGKDLIANSIHNLSKRRNDSFTMINCASVMDDDEQIAFLNSDGEHVSENTIKAGTVLLNGIEELSKNLQQKLLAYLQKPTNDSLEDTRECDVRVIACSSANLEQAIANETFSKELFYRLNVFHISVPTLRERGADIIALAEYFLHKYSSEYNTIATQYNEEAKQLLLRYNWPGNVRELINQVKRVSLLTDGNEVGVEHFDLPKKINMKQSLRNIKDEAEKDVLVAVLETHRGQVASAAKDLGVSRATMYRLLNKHNIVPDVRYYNGSNYATE